MMQRKRDRIQSWDTASTVLKKLDRLKTNKHNNKEDLSIDEPITNPVSPPVCWCGLVRTHHDGREMDINGNMHRFNEPVYSAQAQTSYAAMHYPDDEILKAAPKSEIRDLLLGDCSKLLQNQIANTPNINATQLRSNAITLLQRIKNTIGD